MKTSCHPRTSADSPWMSSRRAAITPTLTADPQLCLSMLVSNSLIAPAIGRWSDVWSGVHCTGSTSTYRHRKWRCSILRKMASWYASPALLIQTIHRNAKGTSRFLFHNRTSHGVTESYTTLACKWNYTDKLRTHSLLCVTFSWHLIRKPIILLNSPVCCSFFAWLKVA